MNGDEVKQARLAAGMTQADLSLRTGVAQSNIAAYESGSRAASTAMLCKLLAGTRPRPSVRLREHRDDVLELAARNKASNVRVFGSIARGEDTPGSDVDLLVSFSADADLFDQIGLIDGLEKLLGVHVDLISDRALHTPDDPIRDEAVVL